MAQLMLLFRIGSERYALETKHIIEIIHRVELSRGHGLNPAIAGQFNYHRQIVQVLDLSLLLANRPSRPILGTRIVLMERSGADGSCQPIGLLVEHVTETLEGSQFEHASTSQGNPQLKGLLQDQLQVTGIAKTLLHQGEIVQCLQPEKLLAQLGSDLSPAATQATDTFKAFESPAHLNTVTTLG
ncbi:MAG: chemotaxis protein CheW [Cyanobacteria bacterium J06598_1]